MSDSTDAIEVVRSLLPTVALRNVYFDEIHATRAMGEDHQVPDGVAASIEMQMQQFDESVAYRFRVGATRSDAEATVVVVTVYGVKGMEAFGDSDVQRTFGELVALPAAYPYARTKIHELTSGMAVSPLVLDVYLPRAGSMEPVAADT